MALVKRIHVPTFLSDGFPVEGKTISLPRKAASLWPSVEELARPEKFRVSRVGVMWYRMEPWNRSNFLLLFNTMPHCPMWVECTGFGPNRNANIDYIVSPAVNFAAAWQKGVVWIVWLSNPPMILVLSSMMLYDAVTVCWFPRPHLGWVKEVCILTSVLPKMQ